MPTFPSDWDSEKPGSRFTTRPAVAVLTADREEAPRDVETYMRDALGSDALRPDEVLGQPRVVVGSEGRGAETWVGVIEWVLEEAATETAWTALGVMARRFGEWFDRLRGAKVSLQASRGAARMLAVRHIYSMTSETDLLHVDVIEEPSTMGGERPTETGYVGAEPWIVITRNASNTCRYLVVVMPDGEIGGEVHIPITPIERYYL